VVNRPNERLNQQLGILGKDSVSLVTADGTPPDTREYGEGERSTAVRVPPDVIEPASEYRGRR
jgi:hypothetical protein